MSSLKLKIKVMELKAIVGIDVSKFTLDVCIKPVGAMLQITNDSKGFRQLKSSIGSLDHVLVVMEHTGYYSLQLERFLHNQGIAFCKVPALQIKRSLGVTRGKTDAIDAVRIAEYGWLRKEQLTATELATETLLQLRSLLGLRSKLVKDRAGYISRSREMKTLGVCQASDSIDRSHKKTIKFLTSEINNMEADILKLIRTDHSLRQSFELLQSIKGVGKIIAASMIAFTENFKRFSEARKFNCYAGLAPFKYESGISIRSRSRVSPLANKELKTLLNLGAFCAIRHNAELRQYYELRVANGKRKMDCINIIRSKIVARMFAVIKRQSPYQELPIAA